MAYPPQPVVPPRARQLNLAATLVVLGLGLVSVGVMVQLMVDKTTFNSRMVTALVITLFALVVITGASLMFTRMTVPVKLTVLAGAAGQSIASLVLLVDRSDEQAAATLVLGLLVVTVEVLGLLPQTAWFVGRTPLSGGPR